MDSREQDIAHDLQRLDRLSYSRLTTPTETVGSIQENASLRDIESSHFAAAPGVVSKPDTPRDIADGALREGEVPNLYSRAYVGLLVQYAAIGVIYGALPRTVYPFLNNYLHMNGYQTLSARVLLSMPWSAKVFVGIISDCFPIARSRRRAYMVLGWLVCFCALLGMIFLHQEPPYYIDHSLRGQDLSAIPKQELIGRINWNAPDSGAIYIVLMTTASCGYLISDVACDGLVVEFAQREPEATRGNIQATIYLVRSLFMIFATLLVGFGLNSVDYGGSFAWSFSMSQLMLICACLSLTAIPAAIWLIREPIAAKVPQFSEYLHQLWQLLQNGAMLQVMAYRFFSGIFDGFTVTASDPIQRYWAHVQPLNESLFSAFGLCVFSGALYMTKRFGLQWNWRIVIATTVVTVVIVDSIVAFMTIWDVLRNQWFWLGTPILEELPSAMNFLVSTFVVVELAESGNEAAVYGLLTTISNLSTPFASCIAKNVNALFDVNVSDIVRDTTHVRWQVTWTFLISYTMKLLSLAWLVLLPRQKRETQQLKRNAGSSFWGGVAAAFIGVFALLWSLVTNLMSIFPSTACLVVAGGAGCH